MVHIGKKIKAVYETSGLQAKHVSRILNTGERTLCYDFERETLQTERLAKWCKALNHNFFQYILEEEGLTSDIQSPHQESDGFKVCITVDLEGPEYADLKKRVLNTLKATGKL